MNKKYSSNIFLIIALFFVISCSNTVKTESETSTITQTYSPVTFTRPVATILVSPTKQHTIAPTEILSLPTDTPLPPTPTMEPFLEGIPAGEYLTCIGKEQMADYFHVLDPNGKLVKRIGPFEDLRPGIFSPDSQKYLFASKSEEKIMITDLNSWVEHQMPNQSGCTFYRIGSWSKDGKLVLLDCNEDVDVKAINIQDGTVAGVLPVPNPNIWLIEDGNWSPDGKWIAYIADELKQGGVVGPYVVPSSCLQNNLECQEEISAIDVCIETCSFWWTSDNLVAVDYNATDYHGWLNPNQIGLFDPQTGALVRNEDLGGVDNLADYSWSPDGRYLVIENTRENGARVVKEIDSGEVLFDLDNVGCDLFLGWLSIP